MTNLIDLIHDFAETRHKHGAPEYNAKSRAALDAVRAELHRRAEPVGSVYTVEALVPGGGVKYHVTLNKPLPAGTLLYAAQPKRELLSDQQIQDIAMTDVLLTNFNGYCPTFEDAQRLVRAVERAHGIGAKEGE